MSLQLSQGSKDNNSQRSNGRHRKVIDYAAVAARAVERQTQLMSSTRAPLTPVTNVSTGTSGSNDVALEQEPAAKRVKTSPATVLIYELVGNGDTMSFQLRPDNTLYDLCDLVCDEWMESFRGIDCGVDEHCWNFFDRSTCHRYESPNGMREEDPGLHPISELLANGHTVGSELKLEYDYGSTTEVLLRLTSIAEDEALAAKCPKRYEIPVPASFQPHEPPEGLPTVDEKFPNLSRMVFQDGTHQPEAFYIFQPGRKKHHAFVSTNDDRNGCQVVTWLPERMESVEELMFALEQGFSRPTSGDWEWEDRVVYPHQPVTDSARKRWDRLSHGYQPNVFRCVAWNRVNREDYDGYFAKAFPKCNAAYMAKPSDRGWISYKNGVLQLCRGASVTPKWSNAPEVFQAGDQFKPKAGCAVATMQKKFSSLQELFCAAEALWP